MAEKDVEKLELKYEKLECNQQEILQTLNNGLKSKTADTAKKVEKLESRFNKLLIAMGSGMFAIILLLVQILLTVR